MCTSSTWAGSGGLSRTDGPAASGAAGPPAARISGARGGYARLGFEFAELFFRRMCSSPRAYSNSSSPCCAIKASSCSTCSRSTPGTTPAELDSFFLPFMEESEFKEVPGSAGQGLGPVGEDRHIILASDPAHAFDVYTRLQGHHIARLNDFFLPLGQAGLLVDL